MVERRDSNRLAAEPFARVRVGGHRGGTKLDRYLTIEPGIAGAVDDAHAALADAGDDLIWAEMRTCFERHVREFYATAPLYNRDAEANSFHAKMKHSTEVAMMPGRRSGRTTYSSTRPRE